ncbi:MAG: SDR family NAD(P)-dependent oxidoreductase [Bacteroidales bacterium]|nr:SDR family NAD(P)-dependent oxidoreductase [Bacteroidales bacterium]
MNKEKWTPDNIPDLKGKVIVVTGGNSGLGYESVKAFAEKGAEVILASRDVEKGEAAKAQIGQTNGKIVVMQLDLMDLASIKSFASKFKEHYNILDVLLNNAGIMTTPYFLTKDGFEGQMGTNHLGHFALTALVFDLIKKTPKSRIVNVSSSAHKQGRMDFDNLLFDHEKDYSPLKSYGRSKLSNLLFTYELQRRLETNNIDAISVAAHPGVAQTNLARYIDGKLWFKLITPIFKMISQDQAHGALPQIRGAVDPEVKGGEYYGPHKGMKGFPVVTESNEASHNKADAKKLWEVSEKLTGINFKI